MWRLSNGGRSVIIETLKNYKKKKVLMGSDYEIIVKAISAIPALTPRNDSGIKRIVNNVGDPV